MSQDKPTTQLSTCDPTVLEMVIRIDREIGNGKPEFVACLEEGISVEQNRQLLQFGKSPIEPAQSATNHFGTSHRLNRLATNLSQSPQVTTKVTTRIVDTSNIQHHVRTQQTRKNIRLANQSAEC